MRGRISMGCIFVVTTGALAQRLRVTPTLSHGGHDVGSTTEITASPKLRSLFAVAAVIMLVLWGCSLVPPIENWGNPNEDGFSYVPIFYATITCLPAGIYLLVGAIVGHGRYVWRARIAFFIAAGMSLLVLTFLVIQQIANNNDGKLFGIQIGFQLNHDLRRASPPLLFSPISVSARLFSARLPIDGDFLAAGTRHANHDRVLALMLGQNEVAMIGFALQQFCTAGATGARFT